MAHLPTRFVTDGSLNSVEKILLARLSTDRLPLLLAGIGRLTSHAGQAHLSITPMHGRANDARALLTAVSERLKAWKMTAEQLLIVSVWQLVCEFIVTQVTGFNWLASRFQPLLTRCT